MKHIVTGIVAHVDAGKTTLSEAMLYRSGELRQLGRVDNGDAFLDSDDLEKKRGITIFSHQASLKYQDLALTLLDTPGHVDFVAQTEQVLSVLDYAILVISATDGVQGYTRTLWHLLEQYHVPVFIFVNKMDANSVKKKQILAQLQSDLSQGCIAFNPASTSTNQQTTTDIPTESYDEIAVCNDDVFEKFVDSGDIEDDTIRQMMRHREIFPCYFGSALKVTGVDALLAGINRWTSAVAPKQDFGAKVFKISHDDKGERLTWVRVTGGMLHTKDVLVNGQKTNQLRLYNGAKFTISQEILAGGVCAVTGLTDTYPGQGLGNESDSVTPTIQPVLNYALDTEDYDIHTCLTALRQLEDEDPQLHVSWSSHLQEIRVQIMGEVQLEILQQILLDRFNLAIEFGKGSILYKETITKAVEGVGHFEPLRHYAEVHLLLQPTASGSGITFTTDCSVDVLGRNWQHQVLTNLNAKEHLGVLTGAPITDMQITLVGGRASIVHSVGGDFKEATWRAVRQGLMTLKETCDCQLLEPWYQFRLMIDQDQVGRAMNDIQRMNGNFDAPDISDSGSAMTVITGTAPVSQMQDYAKEVNAYTHGQGQLECIVAGYRPCHNADEVIAAAKYEPVADLDNTPDSVFCAHGAGYPVSWDQLPQMAHCEYIYSADELIKLSK
ncbi:elongation factor G [Paucilactobacillus wasatchensis]|uniref:Ribosome protection-type tetracycline resistance-like protein n=1 Tax=Paucilactobacillus wasatchensis TaxID=1335616 RepID=A0A0D0Y6E5_9LACO|nr:TetM/TetW/TetO/TetS family tetracycline resistance ribosomal protection protein [Paucilactobacillus wasatchensis]KIS03848.1 Ribosome protection-type tetracycline resistance-like protein [Paucilactobacillus wasatchensis]